jgi:hypothetical protein
VVQTTGTRCSVGHQFTLQQNEACESVQLGGGQVAVTVFAHCVEGFLQGCEARKHNVVLCIGFKCNWGVSAQQGSSGRRRLHPLHRRLPASVRRKCEQQAWEANVSSKCEKQVRAAGQMAVAALVTVTVWYSAPAPYMHMPQHPQPAAATPSATRCLAPEEMQYTTQHPQAPTSHPHTLS